MFLLAGLFGLNLIILNELFSKNRKTTPFEAVLKKKNQLNYFWIIINSDLLFLEYSSSVHLTPLVHLFTGLLSP